jgi:hypothetical protein
MTKHPWSKGAIASFAEKEALRSRGLHTGALLRFRCTSTNPSLVLYQAQSHSIRMELLG